MVNCYGNVDREDTSFNGMFSDWIVFAELSSETYVYNKPYVYLSGIVNSIAAHHKLVFLVSACTFNILAIGQSFIKVNTFSLVFFWGVLNYFGFYTVFVFKFSAFNVSMKVNPENHFERM